MFDGRMTAEADAPGLDPIQEGIRLFNDRFFFEAHEVLEGVWREDHGESKLFLQGLIQISAAYHHAQNGNIIGATTLLQRGAEKVRRYPAGYLGIDTKDLLSRVDADRARLETSGPGADIESHLQFPRIERKLQ
jgi:predicted metal-dependent hydrolase